MPVPVTEQPQWLLGAVLELSTLEGDTAAICRALAESLEPAPGSIDGAVVVLVEGSDPVTRFGSGRLARIQGAVLPGEAASGLVADVTHELLSSDVSRDARVNRWMCREYGVRALAVVPIHHLNEVLGALMVVSGVRGGIDPADVLAIEALVTVAGARLSQARRSDVLAGRVAALSGVITASTSVLLAEDPGTCLVDAIARTTGAPAVMLMQPDGDALVVTHRRGSGVPDLRLSLAEPSLAALALSSGVPQLVTDWSVHPATSSLAVETLRWIAEGGARSAAVLPLVTSDGPVGVVSVLLRDPITVAHADLLGVMQLLAAEGGAALSRDTCAVPSPEPSGSMRSPVYPTEPFSRSAASWNDCGGVTAVGTQEPVDVTMARADIALQEAKQSGRDGVCVCVEDSAGVPSAREDADYDDTNRTQRLGGDSASLPPAGP